MKILQLKYKMHKLVNLVFYLIIFGIGFILGFGVEKINFNKVISQFLFIDNVSAEELETKNTHVVCRDSVNLFDKNNVKVLNAYIEGGTFTITSSSHNRLLYIPCKSNTTYTIQKLKSELFTVGYSNELPSVGVVSHGGLFGERGIYNGKVVSTTITTGSNAKYLLVRYYSSNLDSDVTNEQILDSIQIEEGNKPTVYEPYGEQICYEQENNSFYGFSQDIFGEVSEENKFVYDFITFGLVVTCFTLFVLIVGYIFKKFFGG